MARYVVAAVEDLPPGSKRQVKIDGRAVAIFNVDGRFYALRDVCPHQGAPLSCGTLVGTVRAPLPGTYEYDSSRKLVRCPWHGWEYDLATGQSWYDPAKDRVKAYQVAVEAGETLLAGDAEATTGPQPGPFVAETFPITVEGEYVVVEA